MLLVADVLALTVALTLSSVIFPRWPWSLGWGSVAALTVLLLGAKLSGLHDRDEALPRKTTLDEAPKIFQLATLCVLITWLTAGLIERETLDPGHILELWLALCCLLILTRTTARLLELRLSPAERCLFIGDESTERAFRSKLHNHAGIDATIVARIDLEDFDDWRIDDDFTNRATEIRHLTRVLDIHRAVVATDNVNADGALNLVHIFQAAGVSVSVLPTMLEVLGPSLEYDDLHGMTILGIRQFELNRSSAVLKRAFDLAGTIIGLLAVSPLMLTIAIAIKLDTRGPVFFRQLRIGRHGLGFQMLKFRTMVRDAESLKDSLADHNQALAGLFKINDDPRITRIGRLLRKTSLDELPQLLNVLRGEMSLVGPRPLILEEDSRVEGWQRRRLELSPGMTGQWQILGPVRTSLSEMIAIDHLYVANWSLWTDITILLRTMTHVASRRGM
jgi:exopolysaccharide biosynthesis polyprenyl glycosylphosphotransferase